MSNINVLDKTIFSLISAGEVVEKPASVVKELIENSIDAGATNINIEITNGGISKIKVADNGHGMSKENLEKAFLPHATSKISTVLDLEKIGTLGFRGEALSSICAVSKVVAISKEKNLEYGNRLQIEGGVVQEISEFASVDGTTIIVEDLFFNIPARKKFLSKPKKEESEITNCISRLILANPTIAIKFIANDKVIYNTTGTNLFDAIYTVYGNNVVDNLIEINEDVEDYKISGFIGSPAFTKPNRTYQTLIVNGRYIVNNTVSTAIYKAFENFLMKGSFPFYVLNLKMPLNSIDVNVHPNKLDVKFENNSKIFGMFFEVIYNYISNANDVKKINSDKNTTSLENKISSAIFNLDSNIKDLDNDKNHNMADSSSYLKNDLYTKDQNTNNSDYYNEKLNKNLSDITKFIYKESVITENYKVCDDGGIAYNIAKNLTENQIKAEQQKLSNFPSSKNIEINNFKLIGTIFHTYIIIQKEENIYFIDQHAAHERILFDKFMEIVKNKENYSQNLLVPYIFEVNSLEYEFLSSNIKILENLGFEIYEFSNNCFKVSAVPLLLKDISLRNFFNDLLSTTNQKLILDKTNLEYNNVAKIACKSAIKANDILKENEILYLIELLNKTPKLLCPHGRPIIVEISKKEIEKWFKRIK